MLGGVNRVLAGLLLALSFPAAAQEGGPQLDPPLAQRRPPDTARTPPQLRLARRETVPCGPLAIRASATLAIVGRTGKLDMEGVGALRAFGAGDEAARHPVLVAMTLAVAMEQDLPLEEVTPARRVALLDVLLSPAIPLPACLAASTVQGVRFRVIAQACTDLEVRSVDLKGSGPPPALLYLLMAHRTGEDITEDCRGSLRKALGAPDEADASSPGAPPRP
jgi:hypothetical protein